ncbi:MAG: hypothetical protein WDW36_007237 [Sanguina aurantia]
MRILVSTAAVNRVLPSPLDREAAAAAVLLSLEGFTPEGAARVLGSCVSRGRTFNIDNTRQWLQLLRRHHVQQPCVAISRQPTVLEFRADSVAANADAVIGWMSGVGLTRLDIATILTLQPRLLNISHANVVAVDAWLRTELGWSSGMIATALTKCSDFCQSRPVTLSKKLSALQAFGLSRAQVSGMVFSMPKLFTGNFSGTRMQAKARFLTHDMGRSISETTACPSFFAYSLMGRTAPRWAFHTLHCKGQLFVLGTQLTLTDGQFPVKLSECPSLDEECKLRGLSRGEVYSEFLARYKLRGAVLGRGPA